MSKTDRIPQATLIFLDLGFLSVKWGGRKSLGLIHNSVVLLQEKQEHFVLRLEAAVGRQAARPGSAGWVVLLLLQL